MRLKNRFLLFLSLLLVWACSKDPTTDEYPKQVPPFHSEYLSGVVDGPTRGDLVANSLAGTPYNHFIHLSKGNEFRWDDSLLVKSLYFTTRNMDAYENFSIGSTNFPKPKENYISYSFSNSEFKFRINGAFTESLPENNFTKIPYALQVGDSGYKGHFIDPGSLKGDGVPDFIQVFQSKDLHIKWALPNYPGGTIILSLSTISVPSGDHIGPKVFKVEDNGSFMIPSSTLSEYQVGTSLSVKLSRWVFTAQEDLLIRSNVIRSWSTKVKE